MPTEAYADTFVRDLIDDVPKLVEAIRDPGQSAGAHVLILNAARHLSPSHLGMIVASATIDDLASVRASAPGRPINGLTLLRDIAANVLYAKLQQLARQRPAT